MAPRAVVLDGSPVPAALVGGKGHALNRLIEIGTPVPPTGALTTEAYRWFVAESGLDYFLGELGKEGLPAPERRDAASALIDEAFLKAPMHAALEEEILELGDRIRAGGQLAVRSSATAEDLAAASFAGQYRSFLEVDDDEALLRSVRLVWTSLWLPAPRAYRAHAGVDEASLAMSVVLMRLVPARRAGAAFTVDPAGDGTTLRIEAVEGLAESLVSGEVTPDAFVLPRASDRRRPVYPVIDRAVELALGIERAFGVPQDIEWAHDGSRLFVVQARPITTLPVGDGADGFDTPVGDEDVYSTAGIAEMLPGVLPPLQWTTVSDLLEEGFRRLFDRMRALPSEADDIPFIARIHGRAVLSLDLLEAAARLVPGGSAQEIERQYFGRVINEEEAGEAQDPAKRPGALRSLATSVREVRARQRFRTDAEVALATIRRLVLDPPTVMSCPSASCSRTGTAFWTSPVGSSRPRSRSPLPPRLPTAASSSSWSSTWGPRRQPWPSVSRPAASIRAGRPSHSTAADWRRWPWRTRAWPSASPSTPRPTSDLFASLRMGRCCPDRHN